MRKKDSKAAVMGDEGAEFDTGLHWSCYELPIQTDHLWEPKDR